MRKILMFPMVAGLIVAASVAHAQTGQGCGGQVQSYQRFSYQPAPVPTASLGSGLGDGVVAAPQAWVSQPSSPQVYRRYSYQPQSYYSGSTTGHRKNLWEYAKGDPRRYRP